MSRPPGPRHALPWLEPGQAFPPLEQTWGAGDPIPGLLAAGGALDCATLRRAYSSAIFPWFSGEQPILWWSPDPRMVLRPADFRLHPSLRKEIRRGLRQGRIEIRIDSAFEHVIRACSAVPRTGQSGSWIVPAMIEAYLAWHRAGCVHSVETWYEGELAGALYCVNLGRMVFGESMFSRRPNASKIALAALVACARAWQVPLIDCQQDTAHLASLGARALPRQSFLRAIELALDAPAPKWRFEPHYWHTLAELASSTPGSRDASA